MSAHWFYCEGFTVGELELDEPESLHARRSLRLAPGAPVVVFDGAGHVGQAVVLPSSGAGGTGASRAGRSGAPRLRVAVRASEHVPRPARALTLLAAAAKGERLEWMIEKCTELGVTALVLVEFARSVVHASGKHVEKLRRTALEACKQCRRAWLPEVRAAENLAAAVDGWTSVATERQPLRVAADRPSGRDDLSALLVADPISDAPLLGDWLAGPGRDAARLAVVVGPEGGLTTEEVALLHAQGARATRLGAHILRIETAAIAVAAAWGASRGVGTGVGTGAGAEVAARALVPPPF